MATQLCPKCKSNRVRLGYRPTPAYLKILFRYNLLCDECNWEFTGFAIPGTVPKKTRKKKTNTNNLVIETDSSDNGSDLVDEILSVNKDENVSFEKFDENRENILENEKQPLLFEDSSEKELNKSEANEQKKQKVKKKVRVKFY